MSQITCYLCLGFRFLRPIHGRILHIKILGKSDFIISGCSWSGSLMRGGWVAAEHSSAAWITPGQSGPGSTRGRTARHGVEGWAARNPLLPGPRERGRSRRMSIPSGNSECHGHARRLDSQTSCGQNTAGRTTPSRTWQIVRVFFSSGVQS